MKNIIYKPWIGKNYGQSEFGKLFLIGDSHYNDEGLNDYQNFTIKIIEDLENTNFSFYRKIGSLFNEKDVLEIWSKVAFANAIQRPLLESDEKPTQDDYEKVKPAILEYMNLTKPSKMIIFSKRVWEFGFPSNWGEKIDSVEEINSSIWKYDYEGGICHVLGVWHPRYFRFFEQKKIIKEFLNREF